MKQKRIIQAPELIEWLRSEANVIQNAMSFELDRATYESMRHVLLALRLTIAYVQASEIIEAQNN